MGQAASQIALDRNRHGGGKWKIAGVFDDDKETHGADLLGTEVEGQVKDLEDVSAGNVVIAIANSKVRLELADFVRKNTPHSFATLVHPSSWTGENVNIGPGTIIYPGVKIDPNVDVGEQVQINKNATVGHDTRLGNGVTIAPGVNLGGYLEVNRGAYFGVNSSTVQEVSIGEYAKIGAGATVIGDVPDETTVVGTPANPTNS